MEKRLWASGYILSLGIHLTVRGVDKVDWDKPYIIMSNHESFIDILIYMDKFPAWFRWVAKSSVFEVPLLGWSMWARNDISIDRSDHEASIRSYNKAAESLRNGGRSIIIFPKGTRGKTEEIGPFKKGPFILAIKSQCPILPVVIKGTRDVLKPGSLLINRCDVKVEVGQPINTEGLTEKDRDHLMHRTHKIMSDLHHAIGGAGGDPNNIIAQSGFKPKKKPSKLLIPLLRISNAVVISMAALGICALIIALFNTAI